MSSERDRQIDAETAERVLDGDRVGLARLESLLAAAAAPGRDGEVAGEDAAVIAFREAAHEPRPVARHRSTIAGRGTRLVGVKAAALVFSVAAGGVALAAGTGVLPNPLDVNPPTPSSSMLDRSSTAYGTDPDGTDAAGTGAASAGAPSAGPTPDLSLVGLCQAYVAQVATYPGKALDNPAFAALITAAGGAQNVATYCDGLLTEQTSGPGKATDHPTGPASGPPTQTPTKTSGQASHPVRT